MAGFVSNNHKEAQLDVQGEDGIWYTINVSKSIYQYADEEV